jgi:tripartite-type tricarboxylate transporter receptor subunit TctC
MGNVRCSSVSAVIGATLAVGLLVPLGAHAQSAADFYKGKTVSILVGFGSGGGYDQYSRLLARYMSDHIPGKPNVIVQNMPAAGGLQAANHVYAVSPKDGTAIAAVTQNIAMVQLLGGTGVQYDAVKFQWIGALAASNSVAFTWSASGVKTIDDAKTREVTMVGSGAASDANIYPRILNALIGTKFKIINGYSGTNEGNLALERGEVDGMSRASYVGLAAQRSEWLREKKINIIAQIGFEKEPDLPDVPLLLDLVKTEEQRQIATVVTLPSAIRVNLLRTAYAETLKDKGLLADAEKQKLDIRPKSAEEIKALITKAFETPKPVLEKTATILGW